MCYAPLSWFPCSFPCFIRGKIEVEEIAKEAYICRLRQPYRLPARTARCIPYDARRRYGNRMNRPLPSVSNANCLKCPISMIGLRGLRARALHRREGELMSSCHSEFIPCPRCGRRGDYILWNSVNMEQDPELADKVKDESLFERVSPLKPRLFRNMRFILSCCR